MVVGRLLQLGRQMKTLRFAKFLKFDNFNSKAHLGCLNEFMTLIAIDIWTVFEGSALENYTVVIFEYYEVAIIFLWYSSI